jgi:hypothetical protein
MKSKKLRNDIILIAAIISIAAIAIMILFFVREGGDTAVVYVGGEVYGRYPLDVEKEIKIISPNGTNLLIIKNGQAKMSDASCPDKICVAHPPISSDIDPIACRPNKVVVVVE